MRQSHSESRSVIILLRRSLAVFLGAVSLWLIVYSSNSSAALHAWNKMARDMQFAANLMKFELPTLSDTGTSVLSELSPWQKLFLSQAVFLSDFQDFDHSDQNSISEIPAPPPEATLPPSASSSPSAADENSVIERTLVPASSISYAHAEGVYIYNRTEKILDVSALLTTPLDLSLSDTGPQVLILHTHGSEAYYPEGNDIYLPSDPSRTEDPAYNMVRVGEEMAEVFALHGIEVVHDRALYDYPSYNGSYNRSLAAAQAALSQYPGIRIIIDVHRDALEGTDGTIYKPVISVNGEKTAQLMMVVGSDDAGLSHPKWEKNLAFAVRIQQALNQKYPNLARPISLRTSRYNQQLSTGMLLLEVGGHGNSLQEALRAARLFASTVSDLLLNDTQD